MRGGWLGEGWTGGRGGVWLARRSGGGQEDEEEEEEDEKKNREEEEEVVGSYSWGRNASGCFSGWGWGWGGATGANREPELAEGDYADVAAAAPGEGGPHGNL